MKTALDNWSKLTHEANLDQFCLECLSPQGGHPKPCQLTCSPEQKELYLV